MINWSFALRPMMIKNTMARSIWWKKTTVIMAREQMTESRLPKSPLRAHPQWPKDFSLGPAPQIPKLRTSALINELRKDIVILNYGTLKIHPFLRRLLLNPLAYLFILALHHHSTSFLTFSTCFAKWCVETICLTAMTKYLTKAS